MNCENIKNARQNRFRAARGSFGRGVALLLVPVLCASLVFSVGCSKKPKEPLTTPSPLPIATAAPTPQGEPSVALNQSVGYYFVDVNGTGTLYGGVTFTNNGPVPVVISEAAFTFRAGGNELAVQTFEPLVYKSDIVQPGSSSSLALWVQYKGDKPSEPIVVEASLTPQAAEGTPRRLEVDNAFIADNYPAFSTVSGTVKNPATDMDYSLSIIYLTFFDENDKLLAVWHFTKDMAIPSQESRNFVMHMRSLPISGLSSMTKRIVSRAFGI